MIEDNPGDVLLLRMALEDIGLAAELAVCGDGESAISRIEATPAPDGVLLDLNVPCRDGLEVLQLLRATAGWETVPVMVLTGSMSKHDREQVAGLGAEYFQKPHGYSGFLDIAARIGAKLEQRPARRHRDRDEGALTGSDVSR